MGSGRRGIIVNIMGFMFFQFLAVMMMLFLLIQFIAARATFEPGVEYQPVTISWQYSISRDRTYVSNGETCIETVYDNFYKYTVNGIEYEGMYPEANESVVPGSKDTWYYNPNNPEKISKWSSMEEQMKSVNLLWILLFVFQILAILCIVLMIRKSRRGKIAKKADKDKIRQDMQKNKEIYRTIRLEINEQKMFAVLEPLRGRIYKNQVKLDQLKDRLSVSIGGNPILLVVNVVVKIVDGYRICRIQKNIEADSTMFYMEYKKNIAEPILKHVFEEFHYRPSQGFSTQEISEFQLINRIDIDAVQSEDYIEGTYKGVGYRQADIKGIDIGKSELDDPSTRFSGRISVYDFKKNLDGDVIVKSKKYALADVKNMKKIEMENISFNKKFDVYSMNEHMVYYLLTPQFMEYLLSLDSRGEIIFRFTADKIYVFRNHIAGIFEPDMTRPIDIPYEIGKSYNELKEILDFVDILKLERVMELNHLEVMYADNFVEEDETEPEADYDDDWNRPVTQAAGSSGLRLRL